MHSNKKRWFIVLTIWMLCIITCIVVKGCSSDNNTSTDDSIVQVYESTPPEVEDNTLYYTNMQYQAYPVACTVWQALRENGYNPYVCAGILGNMMTECGGHTLNLDHDIYDSTGMYYGLCQWSLRYTPQVNGLDTLGQLDVLFSNIEVNMEYFGGDFEYFLSIRDEKEAAYYFQYYYERGAGTESRSRNATVALNYFTT